MTTQSNGKRGSPLLLNQYSAARSRAAMPSPAALKKRLHDQRQQEMKASLALINKVLGVTGTPAKPGTIRKSSGKPPAPVGLGELLQARMLKNRVLRLEQR